MDQLVTSSPATFPDLLQFARHGGPDLCDLRGYPRPSTEHRRPVDMSSSRSSRSRRTRSTNPASTTPGSVTDKVRKSTPYNGDFDLHLTDHLIHPIHASQEPNLEGIMSALAARRASLSPSQFSENAFKTVRAKNFRAKDEHDVLINVIPTIHGSSQFDHYCARNTTFANLEPLTDNTIVAPKPDIYYGAYPERLAPSIREELACHIIPSTMVDKPMAPNFFMEAKGPDGSVAVVMRQARYDEAIGSRAIHSLQNYNQEEPVYDGTPYTYSSIYHGGHLQLFAHHVTAPAEGGRPEYHMNPLTAYSMISTRDEFVEGATAFRNARELARQHRDNFIQAANAKAKRDPVNHQNLNNRTDIRHAESPVNLTSPRPHAAIEAQDVDSHDELAPSPYCHHKGPQELSQESTATTGVQNR
ncbi:hypothetical protein AAL_05225 [Moelleriella libera RCEF 2490]|uniref:DUF7924 domain-containing protein n=1 Tax=Moelleriella libera RCEF 2490 TaxID=1081109 RepID=A0A168ARU0_9HYPO|nr:hypothetical protein AAL_05225 [Moelleriella libera RCEF 2490]